MNRCSVRVPHTRIVSRTGQRLNFGVQLIGIALSELLHCLDAEQVKVLAHGFADVAQSGELVDRLFHGDKFLRRLVAHSFDVVTIGVQHECAVVIGMVVRPHAGAAVVATACCDSCFIKRIDQAAIGDPEGDV